MQSVCSKNRHTDGQLKLAAGRGVGLGCRVAGKFGPGRWGSVPFPSSWGGSAYRAGPAPPLVPRNVPGEAGGAAEPAPEAARRSGG